MTLIVGAELDGYVWMGGDSVSSSGKDMDLREAPKVFRRDDLLIGFTTSFRMGNILQHSKRINTTPDLRDVEGTLGAPHHMPLETSEQFEKWLFHFFVPSVIAAFKEEQFLSKDKDVIEGGSLLLAHKGWLFRIDSDFQIGRSHYGYAAIGSGEAYALGAMSVIYDPPVPMEGDQIIGAALSAGYTHSPFVRGPFTVLSTE